jgi:hypothetical protein
VERDMILVAGRQLLDEAEALRVAFPDVAALKALPVGPRVGAGEGYGPLRAALGYLHDEMLVVQGGTAGTLAVLDDEMAHVEDLLARL